MRTKCFIPWFLGISLFFIPCFGFSESTSEEEKLHLALSLQQCEPINKEIIIRIVMTNVSEHHITIPHLKDGMFQKYGAWGGWLLFIEKHEPRYFFMYSLERSPFLTYEDFINLAPGEHITITTNIAGAKAYYSVKENDSPPELASDEGEYDVSIRLHVQKDILPPSLRNGDLWNGEVESNTVNFVLSYEKDEFVCTQEQQHTEE